MLEGLATARGRADACPGALRPHRAADGLLVRLRTPGGAITAPALRALAHAADGLGDGRIGLTSRGNLQLRGLDEAGVDTLAGRARAAGLLPAPEHERVRNVVASPLSGRLPGSRADVDAVVAAVDAGLCARPALAALPGRFLFAVDDGRGDVAGLGADVLLMAAGSGQFEVRFGDHALTRAADRGVDTALDVAAAFLAEVRARGSDAWRLRELPGADAAIAAALGGGTAVRPAAGSGPPEPGLVEQLGARFSVCALAPLGVLTAEQAEALAAAAGLSAAAADALRVTPWRRVVVRDLDLPAALAARELLAAAGLVVEGGTPWGRLTACAGRPGCASALADVHADAHVHALTAPAAGPALHWAGCGRGCGAPPGATRLVATPSGYVEDGPR